MKRLIPTPSMAVALLALIVALSGSAYAVTRIGTNQIKNGAITTAKIRNGSVTGGKVRNGAVGAAKLAPGLASNGGGNVVDDSFFALTDSLQEVVGQDLDVRTGQKILVSAVTNLFQTGSGSDTRTRCRLYAYPPSGSGTYFGLSPAMYHSLGTSGQDIEVPLVGSLTANESGVWRITMECQKSGSASVNHSSSSIIAWTVRP